MARTMPSSSASVTARLSQALEAAVRALGVDLPVARGEGEGARARVTGAQQDALWQSFVQATADDPLAAVRLGTALQAGNLDVVGMLLLSCDTLGEALDALTEYAPIIGDNARFEWVQDATPADTTMRLLYHPEYAVCRAQRVEAALACVLALARWTTKGAFQPRAVWLAHTPQAPLPELEAALSCPVVAEQAVNAVVLDASQSALPLLQAGRELHTHLRALADEMLATLAQGSVSARVQQLLRQHPRWGKERIGDEMGMSGRHLNRKLAAEGISFKGLREALLYELASNALRSGQASVQVGERLGFSDENAFARAFRRWSGQTPAQFARTN